MGSAKTNVNEPTKTSSSEEPASPNIWFRARVAVLRTILGALASLPWGVRKLLGRSIGTFYGSLPVRERRIADAQIARMGESLSRRPAAREVFANIGETMLESFNLEPVLRDESAVIMEHWDLVHELRSSPRGIVALTAHLGNWELLGAYWARRNLPMKVIGREARDPALQVVLKELREERNKLDTIWRGQDAAGARLIMRELKQGNIVAALIDQDTTVSSEWTPFLGAPAKTPSGIVELAKRCDAQIVSVFVTREPDRKKFRIHLRRIPDGTSVTEVLAAYSEHLGELVARYPSQWVWFHKRWRSRPDGTTLSTKAYLDWLKTDATH